jgi:hypothetical protein
MGAASSSAPPSGSRAPSRHSSMRNLRASALTESTLGPGVVDTLPILGNIPKPSPPGYPPHWRALGKRWAVSTSTPFGTTALSLGLSADGLSPAAELAPLPEVHSGSCRPRLLSTLFPYWGTHGPMTTMSSLCDSTSRPLMVGILPILCIGTLPYRKWFSSNS